MASKFIYKEAFNLLCGKQLGVGISRKVYTCRLDQSLVVKVEDSAGRFANVGEWELWDNYRDTKAGEWLAPCQSISPCGSILLQKRVEMVRRAELPEKVPAFLTDLKVTNFGLYEGRIVACDYATVIWNPNMRLKKADWWEA